jgi:Ca2+-binding RTX toxin-like protein
VAVGPGDDTVFNNSGLSAVVAGDNGDDVLGGDSADDQLDGGNGDDVINGDTGDDRIDAGRGDDDARGASGHDVILGGIGNDLLTGDDGDDRLDGADGQDTLRGENGDDVMIGGAGPDDFDGVGGIDTADYSTYPQAGITVDIASGGFDDGNAADELRGIRDNVRFNVERVIGTAGNDLLTGVEQDELLNGRGGDDVLQGAGGDDVLIGSTGADTLAGGEGIDTASFHDHADGVRVDLNDLPDDGNAIDGAGDDVRTDVENVDGSEDNDFLFGSAAPNRIQGFGGLDTIDGLGGPDVLASGDGDDRVVLAKDGEPDEVSCGAGRDFADLDLVDHGAALALPLGGAPELLPPRDCEQVEPAPFREQPDAHLRLARAGRSAQVVLSCRTACRGRLTLEALGGRRVRRLATRHYSPAAGAGRTVALGLPRGVRRVRAVALSTGPSGRPHAVVVVR